MAFSRFLFVLIRSLPSSSQIQRRPPNFSIPENEIASLSLNTKSSDGSSLRKFISDFNSFIRFHCDKVVPESFASVGGVGLWSDENGIREDGTGGVLGDEGLPLNVVEADRPKKVLILMSDTGGGHRASVEALKAAFNQEFGDE